MERIQRLFLLLTVIGPFHMGEQLITGIDEFYAIRPLVGRYYEWFAAADADRATVGLITIVWTICSLMFYAVLRGGVPRLAVLGMFGVFCAGEIHHLIEALLKLRYDPGVLTCIPYSYAGVALLTAVWREYRRMHRGVSARAQVNAAVA
jgi:hypothetical protein